MAEKTNEKQVVTVKLPVYNEEQVRITIDNLSKVFYINDTNKPDEFKDVFVSCIRNVTGKWFGSIGAARIDINDSNAMPSLIFSPAIFDYNNRDIAPIKDEHESLYVILHEVFHIMLEHHYRGILYAQQHSLPINKDTHTAYNIAMDAHLNLYLSNVPAFSVTVKMLKEEYGIVVAKDKPTFEDIMDAILGKAEEKQSNRRQQDKKQQQQGDGSGGNNPGDEDGDDEQKDGGGGNKPEEKDGNGSGRGEPESISEELGEMFNGKKHGGHDANDVEYEFTDANGNPIDPVHALQRYQQASNNFKEMMQEAYRGIGSNAALRELLLSSKETPIDFRKLLRKYIASVISEFSRKTNHDKLNKRQPFNYALRDSKSNMVISILVGIDVSGSMSDEDVVEIFEFLQSLYDMNKQFIHITVQQFDYDILGQPVIVNKDYSTKKMRCGNGGTSFEPWFKWATSYDKIEYKLGMIFTDGCGESKFDKQYSLRHFQKFFWITNRKQETISMLGGDFIALNKKSIVLSREI